MASVEELLGQFASAAQTELQTRLKGFLGGMLRHYLPQVWVFRTELGVATLLVDPEGAATVAPGARPSPDVVIEIGHARLEAALVALSGRPPSPAAGPLKVITNTAKGKAAFGYLRSRMGL
jgi:hypothetical protein